MANCDGQMMYVSYICVSSGAPCADGESEPN
jgi:hypothetical protein